MLRKMILATPLPFVRAYNNPAWKTDENGAIVLKDGNPVYVDSEGAEQTVNFGTISRLNGEAREHRTKREAAEAKLKEYEGLDAKAAREALETVKNIDNKKLIDSGKVDEVKAEVSRQFQAQLDEANRRNSELLQTNRNMQRANAFANSKFIRENIALPLDIAETAFSRHIEFTDDGKMTFKDAHGNPVYSQKQGKAGDLAEFDEAIEIIVSARADKDSLLKAEDKSGTGSNGAGGHRGNVRTMTRGDFEKLPPVAQAEFSKTVREGTAKLVD